MHIVETAFANEIESFVELLVAGTIQADNKAAVDGDAGALNPFDRRAIIFPLSRLPITALLDSVQDSARWAFKTDQDLGASSLADQPQQLRILRNRQIRFGKPANVFARKRSHHLLGMSTVYEGIIIGKLNEWIAP